MEFTPQEQNFLKKMKEAGYDADTAFKEMQKRRLKEKSPVIAGVTGMIEKATQAKDSGELDRELADDSDMRFSERFTNPKKKTSEERLAAAQSVIGFPLRTAANVAEFVGAEDTAALLKSAAEAPLDVSESLGQIDRDDPRTQEAIEKGEFVGGVIGTALPTAGAVQGAKALAKAPILGSTVKNIPKLGGATGLLGESVVGTGAATVTAKGEAPSSEELGVGIAADSILTALFRSPQAASYVKNKIFAPKIKKAMSTAVKDAKALGIADDVINEVVDLEKNNPKLIDDFLVKVKERMNKPTTAGEKNIGAVEVLAEKFQKGVSKVEKIIDEDIGRAIGREAEKLPKNKQFVSTQSIYEDILTSIQKNLNIKRVDRVTGLPVFKDSDIAGKSLSQDREIIEQIFKDFKPTVSKTGKLVYKKYSPRDILSKIRNYNNILYKGSKQGELTASEGVMEKARRLLLDELGKKSETLSNLRTEYSQLMDIQKKISRKTGQESIKSPEFLRRIWGESASEYDDIVKSLREVAKKYKIDEFDNIFQESFVANAIDKASGVKPTSIAGRAVEAMDVISPKVGVLKRAGKAIDEKLAEWQKLPTSKIDAISEIVNSTRKMDEATFMESIRVLRALQKSKASQPLKDAISAMLKVIIASD